MLFHFFFCRFFLFIVLALPCSFLAYFLSFCFVYRRTFSMTPRRLCEKKTKRPSQIHRSTFSYYGNHSSKRSGIRKLDKWLKVEKQEEEEQEFKSKDCFLIHMTYSQQHFPFGIILLKRIFTTLAI